MVGTFVGLDETATQSHLHSSMVGLKIFGSMASTAAETTSEASCKGGNVNSIKLSVLESTLTLSPCHTFWASESRYPREEPPLNAIYGWTGKPSLAGSG